MSRLKRRALKVISRVGEFSQQPPKKKKKASNKEQVILLHESCLPPLHSNSRFAGSMARGWRMNEEILGWKFGACA